MANILNSKINSIEQRLSFALEDRRDYWIKCKVEKRKRGRITKLADAHFERFEEENGRIYNLIRELRNLGVDRSLSVEETEAYNWIAYLGCC